MIGDIHQIQKVDSGGRANRLAMSATESGRYLDYR
jgi:hypothetical protein